ncbi:hypothetical protein ES703_93803 [subsurface metagenome]
MLEQCDIDDAITLSYSNTFTKVTDRLWCVAASAQTRYCRHPWIVPSAHIPLFYQLQKLSFTHNGIAEIKTSELDLLWMTINVQFVKYPVVQRAIILKFQRTNGMCDAFDGIRETMGKIVRRINAPFVVSSVMRFMSNAIEDRIPHIQIWRGHINFCSKHVRAILEFSCPHPLEQVQVFLDRTSSIRTVLARLSQGAAVPSDFLCAQAANVRLPIFN